mgnify:CR=1 FL=1
MPFLRVKYCFATPPHRSILGMFWSNSRVERMCNCSFDFGPWLLSIKRIMYFVTYPFGVTTAIA